jgi:uncharacterized protein (TIGR03905 family)
MTYTHKCHSDVCSYFVTVDINTDDMTITKAEFKGGCAGNASAISKLVAGEKVSRIQEMFDGHPCGNKRVSCAGELSKALKEAVEGAAQ